MTGNSDLIVEGTNTMFNLRYFHTKGNTTTNNNDYHRVAAYVGIYITVCVLITVLNQWLTLSFSTLANHGNL